MVTLKRAIAATIVCFKPHVFLTLCILLVIGHSAIVATQKGVSNNWRVGKHYDLTLTMTTLILIVALVWTTFFIFIVRYELKNELDSVLVFFGCSKRGLRFLAVVGFHFLLLTVVALFVSNAVQRSIPDDQPSTIERSYLVTVYKIWLTAIVYAFLYLILENVVVFYTDYSLVEFVHEVFLISVAKSTGIDLSDYPAGESLINPLVRRRMGLS